MRGCVYLIGAGCGSMELMTLRGLQLLRTCDVVVYDDLIDEATLNEAPASAERIYMGKRRGRHSAAQEEISALLVRKGQEGHRVARLKGGDPFVFGRGGEEAMALLKAGVEFEEVPGISSAIAIPAGAGIPVTHRGLSRSFHVVTGHTADRDGLPEDLEELAKLHGTLVFLMGLSHLEQIAQGLVEFGKAPDTPAAVISGGNAPHPAVVRGSLEQIAALTREAGVEAPAVIVVGETAALDLRGSRKRPLEGVRVGITGTDAMTGKLRPLLEEQGAQVSTVERSVVEKLPLELDLESLCDGKTHWLVFTSGNGVRLFFEHLRAKRMDLRQFFACKFAVIGAATGAVLEQQGIIPDLCPGVYTSEELGRVLCEFIGEGEDAVLLRARKGAAILPKLLRENNISVRDVPLYDLTSEPETADRARKNLPGLDYLTFSSGGGVELYFREHGSVPEGTVCVCIGDVTARALAGTWDSPFLVAKDTSAQGMVDAILAHHREKRNG